jgi:Ca2+-binding EF-hand superfamily protein
MKMLRKLVAVGSAMVMLGLTSLASLAAGSQSGHFIMEMDRDRNGTVSRAEFLSYTSRTFKRPDASRTFKRLDRNHSGSLDPIELRAWFRPGKDRHLARR